MMTYYEELGVPGGASREEIRQAYKRLVRLLHPDRCSDPATRLLAELQMRRLNGILEVLSDPGERARYDRWLVERDSPWRRHRLPAGPGPAQRLRALWQNWWSAWRRRRPPVAGEAPRQRPPDGRAGWRGTAWRRLALWRLAAAVPGLLVLLLFCTLMPSRPPARRPAAQIAPHTLPREHPAEPPVARRIKRARASPAAVREKQGPPKEVRGAHSPPAQDRPAVANPTVIRDRTATQPTSAGTAGTMSVAVGPPPPPATAGTPPAGTPPAGTPPEAPEAPAALAGDWFFLPAAETGKSGYSPEFIELRLSEDQGMIRGRYRARYRVTDRAISPNVAFQFEGRAAAEGGVLPWRGAGGAQGEIRLRLLANGKLEVEWAAAHLGEDLELISGAATLVRKRE
jgi:hypothetical protein